MKIGLQVPYFTWPGGPEQLGATFGDVANRADQCGFASFWVMDHFFQLPGLGQPDQDMLEAYTALGFAAGRTSRIKLGTMVTGVTYRHPGVLVKAATTLDVLSGGRAYLGIGAAWFEREHVGLGVPFPPLKERFERLEEALEIAHRMWRQTGPFEGKHYSLPEPICVPSPLSQPHPPILVGGSGEKKTLKLVALYADACNLFGQLNDEGVETVRHKLAVLREHCERHGRRYRAIEKTILATLRIRPEGGDGWQTPEQARSFLQRYRELGVDQAVCNMAHVDRPETLEFVAKEIVEPAAAW